MSKIKSIDNNYSLKLLSAHRTNKQKPTHGKRQWSMTYMPLDITRIVKQKKKS